MGAHRPRDEKPAWQVAVLRRSVSSDEKRGLSQEEHKGARWQVLASQVVSRRLGLTRDQLCNSKASRAGGRQGVPAATVQTLSPP